MATGDGLCVICPECESTVHVTEKPEHQEEDLLDQASFLQWMYELCREVHDKELTIKSQFLTSLQYPTTVIVALSGVLWYLFSQIEFADVKPTIFEVLFFASIGFVSCFAVAAITHLSFAARAYQYKQLPYLVDILKDVERLESYYKGANETNGYKKLKIDMQNHLVVLLKECSDSNKTINSRRMAHRISAFEAVTHAVIFLLIAVGLFVAGEILSGAVGADT